jgi:hypothetical protein
MENKPKIIVKDDNLLTFWIYGKIY